MSHTVVILTHARTKLLREAVSSALSANPAEILVVNNCPWQDLTIDFPTVRAVKLPPLHTEGLERKRAISLVSTPYFQWLDDDDLLLPWVVHRWTVQTLGALPVAWTNPLWWDAKKPSVLWEAPDIGYTCVNFSASTEAAAALPAMRAPADMLMRAKLSPDGGRRLPLAPDYILRRHWTTPHLSQIKGMGDNLSSYQAQAIYRRDIGEEPSGVVDVGLAPQNPLVDQAARILHRNLAQAWQGPPCESTSPAHQTPKDLP